MKNLRPLPQIEKLVDRIFENLTKTQKNYVAKFIICFILLGPRISILSIKRFWGDERNISSYCSFLSYDNWEPKECFWYLCQFIVEQQVKMIKQPGMKVKVWLSLDLSLFKKPLDSKNFEGFQHIWDPASRSYVWAIPVMTLNATVGDLKIPVACCLAPSAQVLKELRRQYRKAGKPVTDDLYFYQGRSCRAIQLLTQALRFFDCQYFEVWVLFDSGFDSNDLLRFCFKNNLHVLCAIKKSRLLDTVSLKKHFQALGNREFQKITLKSSSGKGEKHYWAVKRTGKLKHLPGRYSVVISKSNRRDKQPRYFLCSDPTISIQKLLEGYQNRWSVEVDYLYVKEFLGVQQFRVCSLRAIYKFISLGFLTLALVQYGKWKQKKNKSSSQTTAQFLHQLQRDALKRTFKCALRMIQQNYNLSTVLKFLTAS